LFVVALDALPVVGLSQFKINRPIAIILGIGQNKFVIIVVLVVQLAIH
jgi:hypothetical protein